MVSQTIAATTEQMGLAEPLAERVVGTLTDPTTSERRTFHEALRAYRKNVERTGKRLDDGNLAPSPKNYIDWSDGCKRPNWISACGNWTSPCWKN